MTKKQKKVALEAAVRKYQRLLGLTDWEIEISFEELEHRADCEARPEYREAFLRFDVSKIKPKQIDDFAAHELAHCIVWPLASLAEQMAGDDPTKQEMVRFFEEELTTKLGDLCVEAEEAREGAICSRCSSPVPRQESVEPNAQGSKGVGT